MVQPAESRKGSDLAFRGSQRNPEQLVKGRELMARSWCVQSQQLLTESQIFKDEVLQRPESADDPPKEMSEPHERGKKFIGKVLLQLAPSHSFCGCTTTWRDTGIRTHDLLIANEEKSKLRRGVSIT